MLGLGFNLLIVPENQDLAAMHLSGEMTESMPESYVDRLAESDIVTVNHLLPTVYGRVQAAAGKQQADVIVQGTRGEVPIMHRGLKKPLLEAVSPGKAVIGMRVAEQLGLAADGTIRLGGTEFVIEKVHDERGTADDVTVWINLASAQTLLGMDNLVHAILALECACAGDRISVIREEIGAILPGVKVVERFSSAVTRAEARATAKTTAQEALDREKTEGEAMIARQRESRRQLDTRRAAFYGFLTPTAIVVAAFAVALLAILNVRDRSGEIGILRAIGWRTAAILQLFVCRSSLLGIVGGVIGVVAGLMFAGVACRMGSEALPLRDVLLDGRVALTAALIPPFAGVFAIVATWLPILLGATLHPARLLNP